MSMKKKYTKAIIATALPAIAMTATPVTAFAQDSNDDSAGNSGESAVTVQAPAGMQPGSEIALLDKDGKELAAGTTDNHSRAKIPFTPNGKDKLQQFSIQAKNNGRLSLKAGQCTGQGTFPSEHQGANFDKDIEGIKPFLPSPDEIKEMATKAGVPLKAVQDSLAAGDISTLPELLIGANGGKVPQINNFDDIVDTLGGKDAVGALLGGLGDVRGVGDITKMLPVNDVVSLSEGLGVAATDPNLNNIAEVALPVADTDGDGEADTVVRDGSYPTGEIVTSFMEPTAGDASDSADSDDASATSNDMNPSAEGDNPIPDLPTPDIPDLDANVGATTDVGAIAEAFGGIADAIGSLAESAEGIVSSLSQAADGIAKSAVDGLDVSVQGMSRIADSFDKIVDYTGPLTYQIYDDASVVGMQTIGDIRQQLFDIQTLNRNIANEVIRQVSMDGGVEFDIGPGGIGFTAQRGDQINCVVEADDKGSASKSNKSKSKSSKESKKTPSGTGGSYNPAASGPKVDTGGSIKEDSFWAKIKEFLGIN